MSKLCKKCNQVKPLSDFHRDKSRKSGRHPNCKSCKKEHGRNWRYANQEKKRELNREWARNNPEKNHKNTLRWQRENPDKVNAIYHRYRTRKTKAGGSYTAAEWKELCKQYDGRCACCGKKAKLTADHVIPVIAGGSSDISNIQPLCQSCNSGKGTNTTDYRTKPGFWRWIQRKLL